MTDIFRKAYRQLEPHEVKLLDQIKDQAGALYNTLAAIPATRETSLAKTKLEEAVMWAVKSITA